METEEDGQSTEQEDPETESSENQAEEGEEEEPKALRSSQEGRLYIGNLPYSMTSAQLVEVFEEAGRVVSVEVCHLWFSLILVPLFEYIHVLLLLFSSV